MLQMQEALIWKPGSMILPLTTVINGAQTNENQSQPAIAWMGSRRWCQDAHRLELPQESHVILVKQPDVVNVVAQHGDAFDAEAKSPPGPDFRIVTHVFEHLGMDHAKVFENVGYDPEIW